MKNRTYQSSIPKDAVEVIEETFASGGKMSAFFFLSAKKVGLPQGRGQAISGTPTGVFGSKEET
jgi:hypothetical protein